jgi:hypothetical protein
MTHRQKQKLKQLKKAGEFRQGRAGCESRLYEVRGFLEGSLNPAEWLRMGEDERQEKYDVRRIAANDVHEVLDHMKRWEADFDIREITLVGLMTLLSGSPYH